MMSNSSNTCVTEKSFVLVPFWVEDVLRRNKLPMASMLDYGKMAELMSVEDRSAFLSLQKANKIKLFATSYNSHLLGSWEQSAQNEQKAVLDAAVVPMSYSETSSKDTYERLEAGDQLPEEKPWSIVDVDRNTMAIVLKPGFVKAVTINSVALNLVREILRVFYGYYEVHQVSQLNLFGKYLELLQDT